MQRWSIMNNTTAPGTAFMFTKPAPMMQKHEIITWGVLFSLEAFFIIIGNVFTIMVFCNTNLRQNRAFYFLLNLAVADFLVGALSMPLFVIVFVEFFSGAFVSQSLYTVHRLLDAFTGFIAIFSLLLVSLERMYAVVFPVRHRTARIPCYVGCAVVTWLLALAVPSIGCIPSRVIHKAAFYLQFGLHSAALLIICIAYLVVWKWVVCHRINASSRPRSQRDRRLARTLAMVTVVSLVAWVPFQLIHYLEYLCMSCPLVPNTPLYASKLLHYGNSMINPVLYCFRIPEFSRTASRLIARMRMRGASDQSDPVELDEPKYDVIKCEEVNTDSTMKTPVSV